MLREQMVDLSGALEGAIRHEFGCQSGRTTALHGRCILASFALAEHLRGFGYKTDTIIGEVLITDANFPDRELHVSPHAWVLCRDHVVDPTAVQLDDSRWHRRIPNAGLALVVPCGGGPLAKFRSFTLAYDTLAIEYQPWHVAHPKRRAVLRGRDALPDRWRPIAAALADSASLSQAS